VAADAERAMTSTAHEEKPAAETKPPVAVDPTESEEQRWLRSAEGKSASELDGAAMGLFLEINKAAQPAFDELEGAGDFEIVDDEVPFTYDSRPEDPNLVMQVKGTGDRMIRLVLPAEQHADLYEKLRHFHWFRETAQARRALETKDG
jgi:hypothetical protein